MCELTIRNIRYNVSQVKQKRGGDCTFFHKYFCGQHKLAYDDCPQLMTIAPSPGRFEPRKSLPCGPARPAPTRASGEEPQPRRCRVEPSRVAAEQIAQVPSGAAAAKLSASAPARPPKVIRRIPKKSFAASTKSHSPPTPKVIRRISKFLLRISVMRCKITARLDTKSSFYVSALKSCKPSVGVCHNGLISVGLRCGSANNGSLIILVINAEAPH